MIRFAMTDNPKPKKMDRKLVAGRQPYEVAYFAKKWKITRDQARAIIKEYGPSRRKCDLEAYRWVSIRNVTKEMLGPSPHAK